MYLRIDHWRGLSCHRYDEILPPGAIQSCHLNESGLDCQIQRSATVWRLRSEQQAVRCGSPVTWKVGVLHEAQRMYWRLSISPEWFLATLRSVVGPIFLTWRRRRAAAQQCPLARRFFQDRAAPDPPSSPPPGRYPREYPG